MRRDHEIWDVKKRTFINEVRFFFILYNSKYIKHDGNDQNRGDETDQEIPRLEQPSLQRTAALQFFIQRCLLHLKRDEDGDEQGTDRQEYVAHCKVSQIENRLPENDDIRKYTV